MKKDIYLSVSIFTFIFSIFVNSFYNFGISFSFLLIFLSFAIYLFKRFFLNNNTYENKILITCLFLLFSGIGILRYEIKDAHTFNIDLENVVGSNIVFEGIIIDEPNKKENRNILLVRTTSFSFNKSQNIKEDIMVSTDLYPEFRYGDLVMVSGVLKHPENFASEVGRDFDYISYLAKDDIYYKVDFASTSFLSSGYGNPIKIFLFKIKDSFISRLDKLIPEPQSSLLSGILLGARGTLGEKMESIFRTVGITHIIALSGYNITIVAEGIMKIFSFLPRMIGLSFGIVGIILFVLLSGSSITAIRAGIMAVIVLLAKMTGRTYQIGRVLVGTLFIMIFINPKILVYDISFQLSFLATLGIIYVSPIIKEKLISIPEKYNFREMLSSTLAAQITVLPLILYTMGIFSLVALPVNILILLFIPLIMLLGFITGMVSLLSITLAKPFAWISFILLAYVTNLADFFSKIPYAAVVIKTFPSIFMIILYSILIFWILKEKGKFN